eukprot:3517487-Rhodomonas_salina.1
MPDEGCHLVIHEEARQLREAAGGHVPGAGGAVEHGGWIRGRGGFLAREEREECAVADPQASRERLDFYG